MLRVSPADIDIRNADWLFRKRDLASHRLKRQATWREGIAEYKAYLKDIVSGKDSNPSQMKKLDKIYERLKK